MSTSQVPTTNDLRNILNEVLPGGSFSIVSGVSSSFTISANNTTWITVPFPTGVQRSDVVCLCGWYIENGWYLNIYNYSLDNSGANIALYNPSTSATGTIKFHCNFLIKS